MSCLPSRVECAHAIRVTYRERLNLGSAENSSHFAIVLAHVVEKVCDRAILVVTIWITSDGGKNAVGYLTGLDLIDGVLLWKAVNGEFFRESGVVSVVVSD